MGRWLVATFALIGSIILIARLAAQPANPPETPPLKQLQEAAKLEQQLTQLFADKQYEKAAKACRAQMKLVPQSPEPHYNLACAMARLGEKENALTELDEAVKLGFTDSAHMREDDDLATLHEEPKFKDLLKAARQKDLDAPHEPTIDIPGTKVIEGFPEGGLRYRLRMDPEATNTRRARLLIWLHPAGSSMDDLVEQMSPQFIRDGFGVVVFTQHNDGLWSDEDAKAMLEHTLPELAKIDGLDANKPILMGFNSGGQVALEIWRENPGEYGGLVVSAAYPLDPQELSTGKIVPFALPKDVGIKSCPIFALIGNSDNGSRLWKAIEQSWRNADVPLTIQVVPGMGDNGLFTAALHVWLKRVAAGELPVGDSESDESDNVPLRVLHIGKPACDAPAYHRL